MLQINLVPEMWTQAPKLISLPWFYTDNVVASLSE